MYTQIDTAVGYNSGPHRAKCPACRRWLSSTRTRRHVPRAGCRDFYENKT